MSILYCCVVISVIFNSVSICLLANALRKEKKRLKDQLNSLECRVEYEAELDYKRATNISNTLFTEIICIKTGMQKLRRTLIGKKILTQKFQYLSEEDAKKCFLNED